MTDSFRHAETQGIQHLWTIFEGEKEANLINNSSQLSDEAKQKSSEKYLEHVISYLGTNKSSTMSGPDVYADFDAYNIYHDESLKVKESLYEALVSYYDMAILN